MKKPKLALLICMLLAVVLLSAPVCALEDEFIKAIILENLSDLQRLLELDGELVNYVDEKGMTPLMQAVMSNWEPEVVEALLAAGADPDTRDEDGWTALMYSLAFNDNPEITKALIAGGADLYAADDDGLNAVEFAVLVANMEILEAIFTEGADVNAVNPQSGGTLLVLAAAFGTDPRVITALVGLGAHVDAVDEEGWTALLYATGIGGQPEVVKALLEAGADPNLGDLGGMTPLMCAVWLGDETDLLPLLIEAGANIDARDEEDWTALLYAVWFKDERPEFAHLLLDLGADKSLKDKFGRTAYDLVLEKAEMMEIEPDAELLERLK